MKKKVFVFAVILQFVFVSLAFSLARPDMEFKIFQFPKNKIPVIDGKTNDWDIVPNSYNIGLDQLQDSEKNHPLDKKDFDINVKVGWVNGLDRLYFLVEAYDDYWNFEKVDSTNDIFELVVDGDLSGGPLINDYRKDKLDWWSGYSLFHGVHAQNYHINIPAKEKSWAMVWGCQPWINELPWANGEYNYNFKQGESGKLVLEFWITPFDYAPYDGPARAVVSKLKENGVIALSWAIIEVDEKDSMEAFYNLSHVTTMDGNASDFVAFRLMPPEKEFVKPIEAEWSFKIVDMDTRTVAFLDKSKGNITKWLWDFGDGTTSAEQNPVHEYEKGKGYYTTTVLTVEGPGGKSKMSKPWDVAIKNPEPPK